MPHRPGSVISDDREIGIFDHIASEPARITGLRIALYTQRTAGHFDPVLGEHHYQKYVGPYEFMGSAIDYNEDVLPDGDEGTSKEYSATVWLARKELEDAKAPEPTEGDVIGLYPERLPHPLWFDIVKSERRGYLPGSESFASIELTVRRRTEFVPERKEGI